MSRIKNRPSKTNSYYLFSEEKCKELDFLLEKVAKSEDLFEVNITDTSNPTVNNIFILFQHGLLLDVPSPIPNSNSDVKYYKLSSPYNLGSEFYRNGGFSGERERNIQMLKDKQFDKKMKIITIITAVISAISGGLMSAVVNILFQLFCNK